MYHYLTKTDRQSDERNAVEGSSTMQEATATSLLPTAEAVRSALTRTGAHCC